MRLVHLSLLVVVLSVFVWLALVNPTMEQYLSFVEMELGKALERSNPSQPTPEQKMLKAVFRSHSRELIESFIPRHTVRKNFGLASLYETNVDDSNVLVLGVGGLFIPLSGQDESIIKLGRMAF